MLARVDKNGNEFVESIEFVGSVEFVVLGDRPEQGSHFHEVGSGPDDKYKLHHEVSIAATGASD